MSAAAVLCVVFLAAWLAVRAEPARRRRSDFQHADTVERARQQMARELQPSYPPPPVMPADDIR